MQGIKFSAFLAAIAALQVAMSVGWLVGWLVGRSVHNEFQQLKNRSRKPKSDAQYKIKL